MRKLFLTGFALSGIFFISCGNPSGASVAPKDSVSSGNTGGPDSAANNGILPPSGSPANANNSSLADTAYKAAPKGKDSVRK